MDRAEPVNSAGAPLQPGARVGDYQLGPCLGIGAMGSVYQAVRAGDGQRVAIKILSPELAANPAARARFLNEAELATLGFTHCDSGRVLAEAWKITPDLIEAIELHHDIGDSQRGGPLVAIVHLSDLLCRLRDLGYGYYEPRQIDFANEPGWLYLVMQFPNLADLDLARFTFTLDEYATEVEELVSTVFAH